MTDGRIFGSFKLAYQAYDEAAAYLTHSEWVRQVLDSELAKTESLTRLAELLEKKRQEQEDSTKKTDLRIYITYLNKVNKKS
ncbi:MAG: hypothetical protein ACE5KO_01590 [Candidatus Bathyarchaeia archaeon]